MLVTKISDQTRQKGDTLYSSYLSPPRLGLPSLLRCHPHVSLGLNFLNPHSLVVYAFCSATQLPRLQHHVYYISSWTPCTCFIFLPSPRSRPSLPAPGFFPRNHATFSLRLRVVQLWLLLTRWRHLVYRVNRPTSTISSKDSVLFLPSALLSILISIFVPAPVSSPILVLVTVPVPVIVSPFSSLGCRSHPCTSLNSCRILRLELLATCKRYLPSADIIPCAE